MSGIKKILKLKSTHIGLAVCLAATLLTSGCNQESSSKDNGNSQLSSGVFYEIFVRSFADSDGNGVGDLNGITDKLDYLEELGIEGIWLTPINPSPSYHGYDVTDYYQVNPDFGTLADFHRLMAEAHKRGIKVIMDLVVNHTSTQHPWFINSAKGVNDPYRKWYTWAEDNSSSFAQASATGGEAWHERNGEHYEATFWEGMPDLNFDNPDVRKEIIAIGSYWLKLGIDGFRLDAAKHIYEDFQTSKGDSEVIHKNQIWWQEFRKGLNAAKPNAYLVSEVWDNTAVVAPYLDHAFNSSFNFELADLIKNAVTSGNSATMASKLNRAYGLFNQESNGAFVDAPFFDNHDKDRMMSLVSGNEDQAKLAASLLLTVPGNPFIYYGDEIGMLGAGADEVKREPMLWNTAGKAAGQTTWEKLKANQHSKLSVESELKDKNSIYNHYKQLIDLRKREAALRDGEIAELPLQNSHVIAYIRKSAKESILVYHNLSKNVQKIDLSTEPLIKGKKILFSNKDASKLESAELILPAYSTTLLK